jgi:hypothetical protein
MTLLYSFLNAEPAPLPERITVDGATRTDPNSFTEEELTKAGYAGPFDKPSYDPETQIIQWQSTEYAVLNLAPQQIEENRMKRIRAAANYSGFWQALSGSELYQKLRTAAASDLQANMLVTELIAALADARLGTPNEAVIANAMTELLELVRLSLEDLDALYFALNANGLYELFPIEGYTPPAPPEPPAQPEPALGSAPEPALDSASEPEPVIDFGSFDGVTSGGVVTGDALFGAEGEDTLALG